MSDLDDLYAERFRKSAWWSGPPPEPTNYPMRWLLDAAERNDEETA